VRAQEQLRLQGPVTAESLQGVMEVAHDVLLAGIFEEGFGLAG
jgi:hypothetical protein